jgi:hypothetical protein
MAWFAVIGSGVLGALIYGREENKDNDTIKAIESGTNLSIVLDNELKNTLFIFDNEDILISFKLLDTQNKEKLKKLFPKIIELEVSFPLHEFIIKCELDINKTFEEYKKTLNTDYNNITKLINDKYTIVLNELLRQKEIKYKLVNSWHAENIIPTLTFAGDSYVKRHKINLNNKIKAKFDEQEKNLKNIKESLINRLIDVNVKIKSDYVKDKLILINLLKHKAIDQAEKSTTFINLFKNAADLLDKEKRKEFILNMILNYKLI